MSAVVFSSSERRILAAAAIVCGSMAALLVGASVLYALRGHARTRAKLMGLGDSEPAKDYQDLCRARMSTKGAAPAAAPAAPPAAAPAAANSKDAPAPTHAQ